MERCRVSEWNISLSLPSEQENTFLSYQATEMEGFFI